MLCINCNINQKHTKRNLCKPCIYARQYELYVKRRKIKGSNAWANFKRAALKNRAKTKNVPFYLTCEDVKILYSVEECFYCEQPLVRPSLDRLDPDKGYERSNCIVVCVVCNRKKSNLSPKVIKNIYQALFGDRSPSEI